MAIGFYFDYQGGVLQLPVNPEELTVTRQGNNSRTEVVQLGEINILRDARLSSIGLEVLFPGHDGYPFLVGPWTPPDTAVAFFTGAMDAKLPMRLVASGLGVNMMVSVEKVEPVRRAGDHDSIWCALSFLQYRSYGAKVLSIPSPASPVVTVSQPRTTNNVENKTHTVVKGDTLWAIAQRELGSGSRYPEIAALNGVSNPNLIFPGQVFQIPSR